MHDTRHALARLLLAAGVLLLGACATTERAPSVELAGFLGDVPLQPGADDEALLVYRAPGIDLGRYDKLLIEPVQLWMTPDEESDVAPADLQRLANTLHGSLVGELGKQLTLVDDPGPGVLRLAAALTDSSKSSVTMDIISMVVPIGMIATGVSKLATGTHTFVGAASAEARLTDSLTGELLFAAADRRVGGKSFTGSSTSWADVYESFNYWTARVEQRLRDEGFAGFQPGDS